MPARPLTRATMPFRMVTHTPQEGPPPGVVGAAFAQAFRTEIERAMDVLCVEPPPAHKRSAEATAKRAAAKARRKGAR